MQTPAPLTAPDHIARGEQHAAKHQLLDGIGIGAGGVEHRNPALGELESADAALALARATVSANAHGKGSSGFSHLMDYLAAARAELKQEK